MKKSQLKKLISESIKEFLGEKQMLNELQFCHPATAGTDCGQGKIWCEVVGYQNLDDGCYCMHGSWCDQHGTNPECDNVNAQGICAPEGDRGPKDLGDFLHVSPSV